MGNGTPAAGELGAAGAVAPVADPDAVERILASAESCFRGAGYAQVTLRQIAEHAGVSKSLVLYHFDSKDHVFTELELRVYRRLAKSISEAVSSVGGTLVERATLALDALMTAVRESNDLALHAMLGARAVSNPNVATHVRRMRRELRALLHHTLQELFGADSERLPLSLEATCDLLWAVLTGLAVQSVIDDSPADLERGFESLRAIFLRTFSGLGDAP